jgi:hypothetical protein
MDTKCDITCKGCKFLTTDLSSRFDGFGCDRYGWLLGLANDEGEVERPTDCITFGGKVLTITDLEIFRYQKGEILYTKDAEGLQQDVNKALEEIFKTWTAAGMSIDKINFIINHVSIDIALNYMLNLYKEH